MFTKIYRKLQPVFRFFLEKPSAKGNWKWVIDNQRDSEIDTEKQQSLADSPQMYLPYQLNYFTRSSESAISQDNAWNAARLIKLSNYLAKAYNLGAKEIPTPKREEN